MTAQEILNSEDFKQCETFHGHVCPGLSIGYRAAKAAMAWIAEKRSEDEEIVAIVETDACSADAIQVITGCTFGKGNFIFRDYGKMALTLLSRNTGRGVRLCVKPDAFKPNNEHMALLQKMMKGEVTEDENKRFKDLHFQKTCEVLETPVDHLFVISEAATEIPPRARMEPSAICAQCGEPTMPAKMETVGNEKICRGCSRIGCRSGSLGPTG
jgi:formylmethanofuran dehydrogenase subunit E